MCMNILAQIQQIISELDAIANVEAQDENHFKQIQDLQSDGCTEYSNSPDEQYAGLESVTTDAGGGVNGPKHAADIRTDSPSLYHYLTQMEWERGKH